MKAIDRLFAALADHTKSLAHLQRDYLTSLLADLDRFLAATQDISKQMRWQGWTTLCLTSLSASFAVAGSLFSKSAEQLPARFLDKLKSSEFLRQTCRTAAKTFGGLSGPADSWFRSRTTVDEGRRSIVQVAMQEIQGGKGQLSSQSSTINQTMQSILQAEGQRR